MTGHGSSPAPSRLPSTIRTVSPVNCDAGFHTVASPNGTGNNYLVSMSAVNANDIWAVGNSTNAGGYDRALAEHWDGNSWTIVATPDPGAYHDDLSGVKAISTNGVWAVGAYTLDAGGSMANPYAAHWDGVSWNWFLLKPYPTNQFSFLSAVTATARNDIWAVGTYYSAGFLPWVDHWDGATWTATPLNNPSPSDNELFAVSAFSSTDAWAVGEWSGTGGGSTPLQSLAYHFDGANWNLVATPNLGTGADNEILGVNALEAGHAVGVGYGNFVLASTPRQNEAWDLLATGTSTSTTPVSTGLGAGDNAILDVARSGGAVWAVGYSRPTLAAPRQTLVIPATWDAAGHTLTWGSAAGTSDSPGSVNSVLEAVAAASPYTFAASGYQNNATVSDQTLTEAYCANHFNLTAPPNPTAGSAFSLTVTVQEGNSATVTTYRGTVHFTSSDNSAVLPSNYTFTPGDNGTHMFSGVVLNTSGNQTITAADIAMPFTTPGSAAIAVACHGACQSSVGTPGARGAAPGPARVPTSRAGANQSGAAPGHPRLPRLVAPSQGAESSTGATVAVEVVSAPPATVAAPSVQAIAAPPAVAAGNQVGTAPLQSRVIPQEKPVAIAATMVARASSLPDYNRSRLALALVPLAAAWLALLWGRRRNNRRLNG